MSGANFSPHVTKLLFALYVHLHSDISQILNKILVDQSLIENEQI